MKKQRTKLTDMKEFSRIEIVGGEFVGTITNNNEEIDSLKRLLESDIEMWRQFWERQEAMKEIAGITLNEK